MNNKTYSHELKLIGKDKLLCVLKISLLYYRETDENLSESMAWNVTAPELDYYGLSLAPLLVIHFMPLFDITSILVSTS